MSRPPMGNYANRAVQVHDLPPATRAERLRNVRGRVLGAGARLGLAATAGITAGGAAFAGMSQAVPQTIALAAGMGAGVVGFAGNLGQSSAFYRHGRERAIKDAVSDPAYDREVQHRRRELMTDRRQRLDRDGARRPGSEGRAR